MFCCYGNGGFFFCEIIYKLWMIIPFKYYCYNYSHINVKYTNNKQEKSL